MEIVCFALSIACLCVNTAIHMFKIKHKIKALFVTRENNFDYIDIGMLIQEVVGFVMTA